MKKCKKCQVEYPDNLTYFYEYLGPNGKTYRRLQCRDCEKKRNREYLKSRGDYNKLRTRDYSRTKRHGITMEQYDSLVKSQDNSCAICGGKDVDRGLAIDHDHSCCPGKFSCGNCIRGLLCSNCNNGLGRFKDSKKLLMLAVQYLKEK
jgi:hypothetical protein